MSGTTESFPRAAALTGQRKRRRVITKWVRRVVVGVVSAIALLALVYAFVPKPMAVELATASVGPLRVTLDEDGKTRVKDRYVVSAPLVGNVTRIDLHPGDRVERGTVLARILPLDAPLLDPRTRASAEARVMATRAASMQAEATMTRVRTGLEHATREVERARALAKAGSLSSAELDRAETELRARTDELASATFGAAVAKHEVEIAESALQRARGQRTTEQFEIVSPVAGQILRVHRESEGAVNPGTPLIELGDPSHLEVVIEVLTTDAVRIPDGARATLERWGEDYPLSAHVRTVEPAAFSRVSALGVEEQRVNVLLDLDEPRERWSRLGDSYRVESRIVLWEGADVLRVNEGALFRRDDDWAVFVVRDGRAQVAPVVLGRRNGHEAQILQGLAAGDTMIVHPSDRVVPGARVVPR